MFHCPYDRKWNNKGLRFDYFFCVVFTADLSLVQPHILHIITFIEVIASDQDHSESNVASACGLIG